MSEVKTNKKSSNTSSVAKSTIAMSVATLSSRITGLIRTWMMAFALGNTMITSAYQVANNMPNVIFDLIAGGLLSAAFIPIFMLEKEKHGKEGGNTFSCNILNITIAFMGILSLIMTIFAPAVIATQTFTVGQDAQVTETAILFFRIFAIQILFYGIGGVFNGILNGERIYFMPAFAPAINNIVVIFSFAAYAIIFPSNQMLAIILLGIGTTLGVAVQCIVQIPALVKIGFKWHPIFNLKDPALFEAIKIAIPTFIYVFGMLIAFTCRNAFSLNIAENGPATIIYAWTWFQLPYGVIAVSLSRTMFTEMSDATAKNDIPRLRNQINIGLSTTMILIIPLATLIFAFAIPLMSLFRAGNFNAEDVSYVAIVLQCWVVSLPFYSVVMYLYNVYASIRKFNIFAIVSVIAVCGQCFFYWLFCTQVQTFGLAGIPIADFIFYGDVCIVLMIILKTKVGNFGTLKILWSSIRVLTASIIGCGIGYLLMHYIDLGQTNMLNGILQLVVCGGVSFVIIIILCRLFQISEIKQIFDFIKRKIKRS